MRHPSLDWIYKIMNLEMPEFETLDQYLDYVLPKIKPFSEDLYETEYYTEKPWLEIRDDENFLDSVLHIFKKTEKNLGITQKDQDSGPDYLVSVDGNVKKGVWTYLEGQSSNIILIKTERTYELYKKVFIHRDFFVLQKHGEKYLSGNKRKYFFLANEQRVEGMEWREIVELLYDLYRFRMGYLGFILLACLLVGIVIFFSI